MTKLLDGITIIFLIAVIAYLVLSNLDLFHGIMKSIISCF